MKGILFTMLFVGGSVAAVAVAHQKGISLSNLRLPGRGQAEQVAMSDTMNSTGEGEVLGAQAPLSIGHFGDRFSGVGKVLGAMVSVLGVQTVKTGEALVKNVSSTPTTESEVIDVSKVVKDISSKVESIPGNLVNQAKIEYCRQILETATASASQ